MRNTVWSASPFKYLLPPQLVRLLRSGIIIHFMRSHYLIVPVKVIGHIVRAMMAFLLYWLFGGSSFCRGNPQKNTVRVCFATNIAIWIPFSRHCCRSSVSCGRFLVQLLLLLLFLVWREIRSDCNGSEFCSSCSINLHNHCLVWWMVEVAWLSPGIL